MVWTGTRVTGYSFCASCNTNRMGRCARRQRASNGCNSLPFGTTFTSVPTASKHCITDRIAKSEPHMSASRTWRQQKFLPGTGEHTHSVGMKAFNGLHFLKPASVFAHNLVNSAPQLSTPNTLLAHWTQVCSTNHVRRNRRMTCGSVW